MNAPEIFHPARPLPPFGQLLRAAVLATAALALAACADEPQAPPRPTAPTSPPELGRATQGGAQAGLGVAPPGGTIDYSRADASGVLPEYYVVVFKENALHTQGLTSEGLTAELARTHSITPRYTYTSAIQGFAAKLSAQAVDALRRDPRVAYVQAERVYRVDFIQPLPFGEPWGLDRIDEVNLPLEQRYVYAKTGKGVNAYIIDTGVEQTHPDFGGRALAVFDAFGGNGLDCHGHGTHVAGTVGGKRYGVAKGVRLLGVRVFDCNGFSSTSAILAGIDFVRAHRINPAVANMSFGTLFGEDPAIDAAANQLALARVFVAAAAGNSDVDACDRSPSGAPAVFTTAASDKSDFRAGFSNKGGCVDAYAPGVAIQSDWIGGTVNTISGTSMASPHVAGVAALYKQRFGNQTSGVISQWIKNQSTKDAILNNPLGTPNRLLYKPRSIL